MKENRTIQTEAELAAFLFGLKAGKNLGLYLLSIGPAGCHFVSETEQHYGSYWADHGDVVFESAEIEAGDMAFYAGQGMRAEAEKEAREVFERYAETLANKGAEK